MMRWLVQLVIVGAVWVLVGCSTTPLLSNVSLSATTLRPTGAGESVTLNYTIGQPAQVSVHLVDDQGTEYRIRNRVVRNASSDAYQLRIDGTAPTGDPVLLQRALPSGNYTVVISATSAAGETAEERVALAIQSTDSPPPMIENLLSFPTTISPNADGRDDVTEITYQLPVTATVDISIATPDGRILPFVTGEVTEPKLHRQVWNGKTTDGQILANGVYTYTIRAADEYGNIVEKHDRIEIISSGQPQATITYSYMAPQSIMLGDVITITMRVKNTGTVPIRTYGPASGFQYTTNEVFSSIADGKYTAKAGGFWRIGVDWDANSGGAAKRYPYRWAITPRPPEEWKVPFVEDEFLPGEECEIIGVIKVDQQENKMGFYVGLIQDGVGFFQDKTGRTIIRVGF
ncbi:MAG: hypothetical protein FJ040_11805 [Chloroflexi bacterium]|nr:hypothetical protein [Chloroflexota bacterium]